MKNNVGRLQHSSRWNLEEYIVYRIVCRFHFAAAAEVCHSTGMWTDRPLAKVQTPKLDEPISW
jgi:hypothetical protein